MQLAPREFDEVFGAVQEYGRLEYRAGQAGGHEARPVLQEAYAALAALREMLASATSVPAPPAAPAPSVYGSESRPGPDLDYLSGDPRLDHRAAAREHVLANRDLGGGAGDLARECLAWISSYRTDLDPYVYRECVLGVLDGYRELTTPVNPWVGADSLPRQR